MVRLLRATQNSNFYPLNTLKGMLIAIRGGEGAVKNNKIVLIENAGHFSDYESLKWIYI